MLATIPTPKGDRFLGHYFERSMCLKHRWYRAE